MDTSKLYFRMSYEAFPYIKMDIESDILNDEETLWGYDNDARMKAHHVCTYATSEFWDSIDHKNFDKHAFPLLRQDQLQKMVELTGYGFTFYESYSENSPKRLIWHGERHFELWYVDGLSLEQLWLAFVMKEKYRKIWEPNKEEWVSSD